MAVYTKRCVRCGNEFQAKRKDAKRCGPTCRVKDSVDGGRRTDKETRRYRKSKGGTGDIVVCRVCGTRFRGEKSGRKALYCGGTCKKFYKRNRELDRQLKAAKVEPPKHPHYYWNIMFFDIESTGLRAPFGELTCAAWCYSDVKMAPQVRLCYDRNAPQFKEERDREVVLEVRQALEDADMIAGWYSKGFDIRLLNARLAMYGERPVRAPHHIDLCTGLARQYAFFKRSLREVTKTLWGVDLKPDPALQTWIAANKGYPEDIQEVAERCLWDVLLTREVFPWLKMSLRALTRS